MFQMLLFNDPFAYTGETFGFITTVERKEKSTVNEDNVVADMDRKLLTSSWFLQGQMYQKKYLVVSVFESGQITFTTTDYSYNLRIISYKYKNQTSVDDKLLMRIPLYDFDDSVLLRKVNETSDKSMYLAAISTLIACKYHSPLSLYIKNATKEQFCEFLINYKAAELKDADSELRQIMRQHDAKHGFEYQRIQPESSTGCTII